MRVIDFKDARCRHCYKCVRHCAVKAISVKNYQAHIMLDHCINCGRCLEVCPQNAKTFASDMERVKGFIGRGLKVAVSIAPSYRGVLDFDTPGQVVDALHKIGFFAVRETAEGAALVTREYHRLMQENAMPVIISTCCPSVNDLVEKYYPDCVQYLAPVVSPMIAHGRYIKKLYGSEVKTVFLGPCIAKKQEAAGDARVSGAIDAILTFEELAVWLKEAGIRLKDCADVPPENPDPMVNRLYPVSGGIVLSVLAEEEKSKAAESEERKADKYAACKEDEGPEKTKDSKESKEPGKVKNKEAGEETGESSRSVRTGETKDSKGSKEPGKVKNKEGGGENGESSECGRSEKAKDNEGSAKSGFGEEYEKIYVDGLENCMEMLECLQKGELEHCFIEVNVCEGGCAKGPASANWNSSYAKSKVKISRQVPRRAPENLPGLSKEEMAKHFYSHALTERTPTEEELVQILHSVGKYAKEDELNCGACGYSTCREKAAAVFQGKAEPGMCMPHALNQAESMSNVVMEATPNMVFVIGSGMQILELNRRALDFLGVGRQEAKSRYIFEFVETQDIEEVLRTKKPKLHERIQLENGKITAVQSIVYIEHLDAVLVTYQDITREERVREQHYQLKVETVEMAQKVIEKQMMVAQEIAGLLGETTAETKVSLSRLRDAVLDEED